MAGQGGCVMPVRFRVRLGVLLAIVSYQLVTGKISTAGMLSDKEEGGVSPGRVQLLVVTLFAALYYLVLTSDNPKQLPEMPSELLLILGGSNLLYLGGKASQPLLDFLHKLLNTNK